MSAESRIKIIVDGVEAIRTIDELSNALATYSEKISKVDDGSEEFKELNKTVEELTSSLEKLSIDIDTDDAVKEIENVSAGFQKLADLVPVKSLKDLQIAFREARDEAAAAEFGSPEFIEATQRAGELKNEIDDINEAIKAQSAQPIQNLGSEFSNLGKSILSLDFAKATKQFETFKATAASVDFKQIGADAKNFGKELGGSVLNAVKSLGKAILANPLLLLASVIVSIGTALFALRDKLEFVQVAIEKISGTIDAVVGAFKRLSDAVGLSNFAEQDALEATTNAYADKTSQIEKSTAKEIALAKSKGASVEELAEIERRAAQAQLDAANEVIKANENIRATLEKKIESGTATSAQIAQYEKIKAAIDSVADSELKLQILQNEANLRNAQRLEKQAADEKSAREKALQEQQKYLQEIDKLREKYSLTERERIERNFDQEIKKIKGKNAAELALIDEIKTAKLAALTEFDQKEQTATNTRLQNIRENEAKILAAQQQAIATTDDERFRIEQALNDKLLQINLERIETTKLAAIAAAKGNADAIAEAISKAEADSIALNSNALKQKEAANKEFLDRQLAETEAGIEKERSAIQKARDEIARKTVSQGILGLRANINALRAELAKELSVIQTGRDQQLADLNKSLADGLLKQEDYEKRRLAIIEEASQKEIEVKTETNAQISNLAKNTLQSTLDGLGQALDAIATISAADIESQRARIQENQNALQEDYNRRRELIEENIKDETARSAALTKLDEDFANQQSILDAQSLALQKQQIKRERNLAIAKIVLANAQSIANAAAAASGAAAAAGPAAPFVFAATLASVIGQIALTIASARRALKEADGAASQLGAGGGGGGLGTTPTPSPGTQALSGPSGGLPTGVNERRFTVPDQEGSQTPIINPVVSVIDINASQNRVNVNERTNTIGF